MADVAELLAGIARPSNDVELGKLKTANHLLGDRKALDEAWARDGYWYFKGVLDKNVMAQLKEIWIDYLQRKGLIDPGVDENRWNGADYSGVDLERILEFNERNVHKLLTENPDINATMEEILGDEPFWLPICEYRANPPGSDSSENRFIYPHQDGFYSRDLDMKICWIPVDNVNEEIGGCTWVEGAHRGPILHDMNNPPLYPMSAETLPKEGWKTGDFEPGDIVIFDLNTPHSGLTNISKDKFRLTFDIRVMEASKNVPTIGPVISLSEEQAIVRDEQSGEEKTFIIDADTYVRGTDGRQRFGEEIPKTFETGETILINSKDGKSATLVRAIH